MNKNVFDVLGNTFKSKDNVIELLDHKFIIGKTWGPDADYTELKCSVCSFKAAIDNYANRINDYNTEFTDVELMNAGRKVRITCNEYIIKNLLE